MDQRRVEKERAFVLHTRPYRNTSLLVELFTYQQGRVSVVARSARGQRSRYRGLLQPFRRLRVSWMGTQELKTLGHMELDGLPFFLQGMGLFSGFYLNELMMRLLPKSDPYETLYLVYEKTLSAFDAGQPVAENLRSFEKCFLYELGYGVSFAKDHRGERIDQEAYYRLMLDQGFVRVDENASNEGLLKGADLLAIAIDDYGRSEVAALAKAIMRRLINSHLQQPLNSREWLQHLMT